MPRAIASPRPVPPVSRPSRPQTRRPNASGTAKPSRAGERAVERHRPVYVDRRAAPTGCGAAGTAHASPAPEAGGGPPIRRFSAPSPRCTRFQSIRSRTSHTKVPTIVRGGRRLSIRPTDGGARTCGSRPLRAALAALLPALLAACAGGPSPSVTPRSVQALAGNAAWRGLMVGRPATGENRAERLLGDAVLSYDMDAARRRIGGACFGF